MTSVDSVVRESFMKILKNYSGAMNILIEQAVSKPHFYPISHLSNIDVGHDEGGLVFKVENETDDYGSTVVIAPNNVNYTYQDYNTGKYKTYLVRPLKFALAPYRSWLDKIEKNYGYETWENIDESYIELLQEAIMQVAMRLRNPRIDIIIECTKNAIDDYDGALRMLRNNDIINHLIETVRQRFARLQLIKLEENTPASNEEVYQIHQLLNQDIMDIIHAIHLEIGFRSGTTKMNMRRSTRRKSRANKPKKSVKRKSRAKKPKKSVKRR